MLSICSWAVRARTAVVTIGVLSTLTAVWVAAPAAAQLPAGQGPLPIEWMRGGHMIVTGVALSADGSLLATSENNPGYPSNIKIRRISDGMLLRTIYVAALGTATISPDGQFVAASCQMISAASTWQIGIWRTTDGSLVAAPAVSPLAHFVQFSPDSTLLAAGDGGNGVKLWRVTDGSLAASIGSVDGETNINGSLPFEFSPDGREIAQLFTSYEMRFYSAQTGAFLRKWATQNTAFGPRFYGWPTYSPDGQYVLLRAVVQPDYLTASWTAAIFDAPTGRYIREIVGGPSYELQTVWWPSLWLGDHIYSLVFSSNGEMGRYIGSNPYTVCDMNLATGTQSRMVGSMTLGVFAEPPLAASADGRFLAVGAYDEPTAGYAVGVLGIHDTSTGCLLDVTPEHRSAVFAVAWSPDGQTIASGGLDRTIKLWNRTDGSLIRTVRVPLEVSNLAFTPDGLNLVVGYGSPASAGLSMAEIRRCADGAPLLSVSPPNSYLIKEALCTPDGASLVTIDSGGYVRLWSMSGANTTTSYVGDYPACMDISPDGTSLVVGRFYTVCWLRLPDLQPIGLPTALSDNVRSLAFTRDGSRVVASGGSTSSGSLWVLEAASRALAWSVSGLPNTVLGMDVDPEGAYVAAASGNLRADGGRIDFYRMADGAHVGQFDQEAGSGLYGVPSLRFAPDGYSFAYARYDDAVVVSRHPFRAQNHPPDAMPDTFTTDQDVTLTIAAPGVLANDSDPDGNSLTAALVTGPSNGSLTLNANGSFTYIPAPGFYGSDSFTYKASDGSLDSNEATVSITVRHVNHPPVADAGPSQRVSIPHDGDPSTSTATVTLDGSASSDPDGDALVYRWDDGYGHIYNTAKATVSYPAGTYSATLTVTDTYGATNTKSVVIIVAAEPNQAPVAAAGDDQAVTVPLGAATASFSLDGTTSSDPDNDALTYEWSLGGSVVGTTATLAQSQPPGTYAYTLKVTDPYGASSTDDVTVVVRPAPHIATSLIVTTGNMKRGVTTTMTLHLDTADGPLVGKRVMIYIDGALVGKVTSAKPARFDFTPPASMALGNHVVTVRFEGDADYMPSDDSKSFKVIQ